MEPCESTTEEVSFEWSHHNDTGFYPQTKKLLSIYSGSSVKQTSQGPGMGYLAYSFAGYGLLASQSPYPIIVYSVANYKPHLSHFRENM